MPCYTKSQNRGHLAAILACKLFDKDTLIRSNVLGRRKERLDSDKGVGTIAAIEAMASTLSASQNL